MNRFHRLLVRWDKKPKNYRAFLHFACGLIAFRAHRVIRIGSKLSDMIEVPEMFRRIRKALDRWALNSSASAYEMPKMLRRINKALDRWMCPPIQKFEKEEHIRHAIEFVLSKKNYRAIFRGFVENGLLAMSDVSEEERQLLLECISKAEKGEIISAASLPVLAAKDTRVIVGSWLSNALRTDLVFPPLEEVVTFSFYCDERTSNAISSTFRSLGLPDEKVKRMCQLRQFAFNHGFCYWGELSAFFVGPCFASCGNTVSFIDAILFPMIGSEFYRNQRLGAVFMPKLRTVVIRTSAFRWGGLDLGLWPIDLPLDLTEVKKRFRRTQWEVEEL